MILEYIDGTLDPEAEQTLFEAMVHQSELRASLRQFITIGDAVRADREAFVPPAFIEQSLMAGLGLSTLGAEVAAGGAGAGTGAAAGGFLARMVAFKGIWSVVTAFVAGAIMAGGGVYVSLHDTARPIVNPSTQAARVEQKQQLPVQAQLPRRADAAPGLAAASQAPAETVSGRTHARHSHSVDFRNSSQSLSGAAQGQDLQSIDRAADQVPSAPAVTDTAAAQPRSSDIGAVAALSVPLELPPSMREAPGTAGTELDEIPIESPTEEPPSMVMLEIRKQQAWSLQENRARIAQISLLQQLFTEDIAFGSYLRLDEHLSVGAEVGWDRFSQTLSRGQTGRIDQEPKFFWGGLALRYSGDRLFDALDIHPFLQATGGLTSVGPLLRTRLGTQWNLLGPLSWNLAGEASSMVYMTNGQRQLTGRFGVTLGMQLGL
jgi:hypothetical protein